jgi:hypothetical protein
VSDGSVFEEDISNGDIFVLTEQAVSGGVDIGDTAWDDAEDEIKVVDHQVHDDSDVGATPGVDTFASRDDTLNGLWFDMITEGFPDGVKAFDMTDLQRGLE